MNIKAAIFDLDGTLINTEIIKDILFSFLSSCGFDKESAYKIYKSARGKDGKSNFTLENLKKEIVANVENGEYPNTVFSDENWNKMIKSLDDLQDKLLVEDAKEIISFLLSKKIPVFLLTLGSPEWQKKKIVLSGLDKILCEKNETLDESKKIICTSYEETEKGKIDEIDNILDSINNFDGDGVILFNDKPDETEKIINTYPKMRFFIRREVRDIRYIEKDFERLQKNEQVLKISNSLNFVDEIKKILNETKNSNEESEDNLHISSGAIVYKTDAEKIKILLMYRQDTNTFHLPKGTKEDGENLVDTALREIKEETGCKICIKRKFISADSSFKRQGIKICKRTYYFIADYIDGDFSESDKEHDEIFFAPYSEALIFLKKNGGQHLGYENEFEVLKNFGRYVGLEKI